MATLLPRGKQQFIDATGAPLVGGKVFHYVPSTTTAKDTYQDANASILNTNPIILDGRGEAVIYGTGSYRQLVQDSLGNTIWDQLTADTSSTNNIWGGASTGTANAQIVLAGNFSSQSGQTITFRASFTNTGSLTVNGIPVLKDTTTGPVNLTGSEVVANNVINIIYDATLGKFHLAIYPIAASSYMLITGGTFTGTVNYSGGGVAVFANTATASFGTGGAAIFGDPSWGYFRGSTGNGILFQHGNGSTTLGTIDNSGNFVATGSVTQFSDERLKSDIRKVDNALALVGSMRGVRYTMNSTGAPGVGVIAQEMQAVVPEVVIESGDRLAVAYGSLAGVFIEAIKELTARVEALEARP